MFSINKPRKLIGFVAENCMFELDQIPGPARPYSPRINNANSALRLLLAGRDSGRCNFYTWLHLRPPLEL
jgi:hypothetical protein